MTEPTPQWDVGRFVQTLAYFEVIPVVSWLQKMFQGNPPPAPIQSQPGIIFDFSQPTNPINQLWGALDDVVMGGVSASAFRLEAGIALFTGNVSTANSGGFASVRTRNFEPPIDLTGSQGIELRVKGDGMRYKFLLRDQEGWDAIAYAYSFNTVADQWMTVQIPFASLIPVFRAKTVKDAQPINSAKLRSMQLMLSKFEYDGILNPHFAAGSFTLQVSTIRAY
jgi:Complex I intermediate-associated protein 30 (CIA30)